MNSKHLVAPDLLAAVEAQPNFPVNMETLPKLRAMREAMYPPAGEVKGVEAREETLPGLNGHPDVRALVYRPTDADPNMSAILHIHGGGYVLGMPEMSDLQNKLLSRSLGCLVASVDYRLAPETAHPGPVEDCYAGLAWLHSNAETLGIDPSRIAIKGESAGGGLAAGLALLARDRGEFAICHQHLTYPMIDDRSCTSTHGYVGEFIWTRASNEFGWAALLGEPPGGDNVSPYAAAARAEDVSNLPPTFISTAALDLFLEENLEYARRLTRAGVALELHVYPGAYHGFQRTTDAAATEAYLRDSEAALAAAFRSA